MTKEKIIENYEFEEVTSGHIIMSVRDLHNIMQQYANYKIQDERDAIKIMLLDEDLEMIAEKI